MSQEIFSKKEFEEGALCACSAGLFREYIQKPYFVLVDFKENVEFLGHKISVINPSPWPGEHLKVFAGPSFHIGAYHRP